MSPYERIKALYDAHPHEWTWHQYIDFYAAAGHVVAGPWFFAMAREVVGPRGEGAWYVHALAGDMREALRHLPYHLPWIGWDRLLGTTSREELRFYPTAVLFRHLLNQQLTVVMP